MAFQRTIAGAHCLLYINGKKYNEVQKIVYNIDYGEKETYGVDSVFAQEIHVTRISVSGRITGVRVKNSGGLQGANARPLIFDALNAPYISLRIKDRSTNEDIIFIPQCKVKTEGKDISAKGVVSLNFSFSGIQPQQPLDRLGR